MPGDFWHCLFRLGSERPAWAAEALADALRRSLVVARGRHLSNPLDERDGPIPPAAIIDQVIQLTYQKAPEAFLRLVLPPVLEIIAATTEPGADNGRLRSDRVWRWRDYRTGYSFASNLLMGLEYAVRDASKKDPEALRPQLDELRKTEFETAHFLILRAYAANGATFAEQATCDFIREPDLLSIGYRSGDRFAAIDAIRSATPYCSETSLRSLEQVLLSYYPGWERTLNGLKFSGQAQFSLLSAIDPGRRSEAVKMRIQELEHKFGPERVEEPAEITGGAVPSPIPSHALSRMTDDQWLSALAEYNSELSMRLGRGLTGGALQLSQDLLSQTKKEPDRFARLLRRFPLDAHPFYIEAVLRGLSEGDTPPNVVLSACAYVFNLPGRPAGGIIPDCIAKLGSQDLSEELLALVSWYATEDPNPEEEDPLPAAEGEREADIITAGINCVRGRAANAMATLIHATPTRVRFFRNSIERMVRDRSIAVRSVVALVLGATLKYDRDFAVEQFLHLCDTDDRLLGTQYVEQFVYYSAKTHLPVLKAILQRMVSAHGSAAKLAGGRQVCVVALRDPEIQPLLAQCLEGSEDLRAGVAEVCAATVTGANYRKLCVETLTRLFDDSSDRVQNLAAGCFRYIKGTEVSELEVLANSFVTSAAFVRAYSEVLRTLDETGVLLPETTYKVCARFIEFVGDESANRQSLASFHASVVSRLVVRVYGQTQDSELRRKCLDLIDRMSALEANQLDEALAAYER
jgi:hypothetical protein